MKLIIPVCVSFKKYKKMGSEKLSYFALIVLEKLALKLILSCFDVNPVLGGFFKLKINLLFGYD